MRRPWQYWLFYVAALTLVICAMGWLTLKALEVDRAEALARQQAELEEDIGRALWRMDVKLVPHLAREAARPYFVYKPLLNVPNDSGPAGTSPKLSPLLTDRSEFVRVNFQVEPGDVWSSPQTPSGAECVVACDNGISIAEITQCTEVLAELQEVVSYELLSFTCPSESPPPSDAEVRPGAWQSKLVQNAAIDSQQLKQNQQVLEAQSQAPGQVAMRQSPGGKPRLERAQARIENDLLNRDAALQRYAQQEAREQRVNLSTPSLEPAQEGVSRPIWVGQELLLARRVELDERVVIQGCWLDWPHIRDSLIEEVADVLPQVELQPVSNPEQAQFGRMLATLPVQLVVPDAGGVAATWSTMRVSLATAWACLLVTAVAAGVLLHGVLTLSERRGSFVSAVTHELRTPLTTFRMYSEMLAQDMVPDETKRRRYLDTLRVEADRLSHLVENVLAYAGLERGRQQRKRETLTVDKLLSRMESRLQDRASQAEMEFLVEADSDALKSQLQTDPAAVEQILFNLVDNACKYASASQDRRVHVEVETRSEQLDFRVRDHGVGILPHDAKRLFRPFSKSADEAANSAPGVGLGLALCQRLARELNGRLELESTNEGGAAFVLTLPRVTHGA
jgi:signal transduction histidine kinase